MYQLEIVSSGGGPALQVRPLFDSQASALAWVHDLDARFAQWERDGFPELEVNDPLRYYEGCDVYITHTVTNEMFCLGAEDEDPPETWVPAPRSWRT